MSSSRGSASTSNREASAKPPDRGATPIVQDLLRERRELLVANERLRLELDAARATDSSNPRVHELEAELRRLEHALEVARDERDCLRQAVETALARGAAYSRDRKRG